MESKIRVLSEHTINKIAAGEVIENPSSIVKELVENSIDAEATAITVEIRGGGRQMIRVHDNGYGMNRDDAVLCLERHATSKLRDNSDLHALMTMGFRGEAIPSIAAVSKFNLITCARGEETGSMVIVDGGKFISCSPAARSPGTTIEAKALFYNVPVRKKFLRSPAFDANEILKVVSLMALGHPAITFELINDGKNVLKTDPLFSPNFQNQLLRRIENVLGEDFSQHTQWVEAQGEGIALQGVIGIPSYTRHNRMGQYLFLNRRAVVSPPISFAVKDGFATAIESNRFPVFLLHLTLPGDWVDVNVHPQKREVRLRQEQAIKELIVQGIRKGLTRKRPADLPHKAPSPSVLKAEGKPQEHSAPFRMITTHTIPQVPIKQKFTAPSLPLEEPSAPPPRVIATIPRYLILDETLAHSFVEKGSCLKGQGGILLVDQRNAHARVLFEQLAKTSTGGFMAQQTLLLPPTIDLLPLQAAALRPLLPQLNEIGIHIREFGRNTFIVDAIPQLLGLVNPTALIDDIVAANEGREQKEGVQEELWRKVALAASRAAVSGEKRLTVIEGQSIVNQLAACTHPYHCPSGKPTLVRIPSEELAKLFQK